MARAAVAAAVLASITLPISGAVVVRDGATDDPMGGVDEISRVTVIETGSDGIAARASERVAAMSVREQAAAIVMGHIPTTDPDVLAAYMESSGIGGFLLMGANIPSDEAALRGLTSALTGDDGLPPLIAIDQEGGDVSRLPWDDFPSALTLKSLPPDAARDAFAGRGALLLRAGIGVNFGIVADETDDPSMFIYRRALGTTPDGAADRVAAALDGESTGAISTVKHFPGHGAAPGDSHSGIPTTGMSRADWESADGVPFRAAVEAGAPVLMFGHLAYTAIDPLPASLSETWHEIVRTDVGFRGVTITDDLGMLEASGLPEYADPVDNAVAAVAAGNDMVLTVLFSTADTAPDIVSGIVAATDAGLIPHERLREAAERVTLLRLQLAAGVGLVPCEDC